MHTKVLLWMSLMRGNESFPPLNVACHGENSKELLRPFCHADRAFFERVMKYRHVMNKTLLF
jgi:hypothetical protein